MRNLRIDRENDRMAHDQMRGLLRRAADEATYDEMRDLLSRLQVEPDELPTVVEELSSAVDIPEGASVVREEGEEEDGEDGEEDEDE